MKKDIVSIHDVASYILSKFSEPISTMKLEKLCYYSQGWSLAWDGAPLFGEDFQAWAGGPVCPELFKEHRGLFSVDSTSWTSGDQGKLSYDQKETVDVVVKAYGELSGQQLSNKTHREAPWKDARGTLPAGARSRRKISKRAMQDFFCAMDAEA